MNISFILIVFFLLFIIETLYFKIADYYNIIDKPNHRSSHTNVTIRGGGVIFTIAILFYALYTGLTHLYFFTGLLMISTISFIDDIGPVSSKIRIIIHLVAVALMFYQLQLFILPFYGVILAFIVVIGSINAINFMDGINGITGGYGLITLATLYYINRFVINFIPADFVLVAILAVLVFNFFNFRTKAKCFAGDVGSVSLAFIILFFILQLIIKTNNPNYILLLVVYGLDTSTTILFRLLRKENISEAHRSHFYQFLVNEQKIPHIWVASLYAITQGLINFMLIIFLPVSYYTLIISIAIAFILFICLRLVTEGSVRLLKASQ